MEQVLLFLKDHVDGILVLLLALEGLDEAIYKLFPKWQGTLGPIGGFFGKLVVWGQKLKSLL